MSPGSPARSATGGTCRTRWRCSAFCPGCRASTTATSSGSRASSRTDPVVMTPYAPNCLPSAGSLRTPTQRSRRSTVGVIGLRRRHPWLVDAVTAVEQVTDGHLVVRSRARTGKEALALALNLTDAPYALPAGARVVESEPASAAGRVAPHGWVVFSP